MRVQGAEFDLDMKISMPMHRYYVESKGGDSIWRRQVFSKDANLSKKTDRSVSDEITSSLLFLTPECSSVTEAQALIAAARTLRGFPSILMMDIASPSAT